MKSRKSVLLTVACSCVVASGASAQLISASPHPLGSNRLYVGNLSYNNVPSFFDVFFDVELTMGGPPLMPLTMATPTRSTPMMDGVVILDSSLPSGAATPHPIVMSILETFVSPLGGAIGEGASDTVMIGFAIMGVDPALGAFQIRASQSLVSSGHYAVTYNTSTGLYHIDSFFDVFTELSLDGGQSWIPSNGPSRLTIAPAPGAAALLNMGVLLACRRRRR